MRDGHMAQCEPCIKIKKKRKKRIKRKKRKVKKRKKGGDEQCAWEEGEKEF